MKYCFSILLFLLVVANQQLFGQDKKTTIKIEGYVELEEDENFGNVKITIYENGAVKETHLTESDGRFEFTLDLNSDYIIEASKKNRCTKKISFNTKVPADSKWKLGAEFSFFLFTLCPGMDLSVLDEPVAKVKFNPQTTYFDEDQNYSAQMGPKMKDLADRLEKCRYKEVQDVIDKADESFKNNDYVNATKLYKEVEKLDPDNKYAPKQIAEIEKLKKKQAAEERKYQEVIQKADIAYSNKKNDDARELYKQALTIKPNDAHSKDRLDEIEKLNQKIASETNTQKVETERYDNLIAQAEKANDPKEAIKYYQEALIVRPNETMPQQRIAALEQKLAKENQDSQSKKQKQEAFDKLFNEAEGLYAENKFDQATVLYNQANAIFPDPRIKTRLYDMDAKRTVQAKQFKQMVSDNLDNAKKAYKEGNYELARQLYTKVLDVDSTNKEAQNGIILCDNQLGEKKAKELQDMNLKRDYQNNITQGDNAFSIKQYALALTNYRNALQLKPDEMYPANKIKEIEKILNDQKTTEANDKARKDLYNKYIIKADKLFYESKLADAETAYRAAIELFAQESYPNEQIAKITAIRKQQDIDLAYNKAINDADDAYTQNNYVQARSGYKLALEKKPNDSYATQQLQKIDSLEADERKKLAETQSLKEQYKGLVAEGDKAFANKNYTLATNSFQSATEMFPNEPYPKQRLIELDKIRAKENAELLAKQEKYNTFMEEGGRAMNVKNYDFALNSYQAALALFPNETIPQQKIAEIGNIKKQLEADSKAKRENYNKLIADADNAFGAKNYAVASLSYQNALTLFPDEQHPKQRINEIELLKKQQDTESKYRNFVTTADAQFKALNYTDAKKSFQLALEVKPSDAYATRKIEEINKAIADQELRMANEKAQKEKEEREAKERQQKYAALIAEGDKQLAAGNLQNAALQYNNALVINPGQTYPLAKLSEIERLTAANKIENEYKQAIAKADNTLATNDLIEARTQYSLASQIKPNESYPKEKISEITKRLEKQQAEKLEKDRVKVQYNSCITRADKFFDAGKYDDARIEYEKARDMLPEETYPRQKLLKIKEMKDLLAQNSKKEVQPVKEEKKALADLKFTNDKERDDYLKGLREKYPVGVTKEVYKDDRRTITRYIIIRGTEVNDYREIRYNWGGVEYFKTDKPANAMYFNQQVGLRSGEKLYE